MKAPTFKQRFQYWFDNYMSQGTGALIGGLAVVSVVIISIAAPVSPPRPICGAKGKIHAAQPLAWHYAGPLCLRARRS